MYPHSQRTPISPHTPLQALIWTKPYPRIWRDNPACVQILYDVDPGLVHTWVFWCHRGMGQACPVPVHTGLAAPWSLRDTVQHACLLSEPLPPETHVQMQLCEFGENNVIARYFGLSSHGKHFNLNRHISTLETINVKCSTPQKIKQNKKHVELVYIWELLNYQRWTVQ